MANTNLDAVLALRSKIFKILTSSSTPAGAFLSFLPGGIPQSEYTLKFLKDPEATEQAFDFAQIVNNIPMSTGDWVQSGSPMWDIYKEWLEQYIPPAFSLTPDEVKKLEEAEDYVSANFDTYTKYQQVYNNCYCDLYTLQIMPLADRPKDYNTQLMKARMALDSAKKSWDIQGHKSKYETQYAIMQDLSERDPERVKQQLKEKLGSPISVDKGDYYPTTISPANLLDSGFQWNKYTFFANEIEQYSKDSTRSWGANASVGALLWSASVDHEGRKEYHEQQSDTSNMSVEFEMIRTPILRSWFTNFLLFSRAWKWAASNPDDPSGGNPFSNGLLPAEGRWPMIPTEAIIVRNLKVKLDMSSSVNKASLLETKTATSGGYGPFSIKGNVQTSDGTKSYEFSESGDGIVCEQPQIIAFFCTLMPKEPNPNWKLWNQGYKSNIFPASGRVIDSSGRALSHLRVEVWDKNQVHEQLLTSTTTDANGNFEVELDLFEMIRLHGEQLPDAFFKIFHNDKLVHSTEDSIEWHLSPVYFRRLIEVDAVGLVNYAWPGYPEDNASPYNDTADTTPTTIGVQRPFSDQQKALLIATNIERNGGLLSDYYGLPDTVLPLQFTEQHQNLKVPIGIAPLVRQYGVENFVVCANDDPDAVQIDHIIPQTKNGSNSFLNAACCSRACNITKGNYIIQTLIDYYSGVAEAVLQGQKEAVLDK